MTYYVSGWTLNLIHLHQVDILNGEYLLFATAQIHLELRTFCVKIHFGCCGRQMPRWGVQSVWMSFSWKSVWLPYRVPTCTIAIAFPSGWHRSVSRITGEQRDWAAPRILWENGAEGGLVRVDSLSFSFSYSLVLRISSRATGWITFVLLFVYLSPHPPKLWIYFQQSYRQTLVCILVWLVLDWQIILLSFFVWVSILPSPVFAYPHSACSSVVIFVFSCCSPPPKWPLLCRVGR